LPLLDLADLRTVVGFLTSPEGKADLEQLGGLSSPTVDVILRSPMARDLARTAAREIVRGVFGIGRRRR
jgi:hypothetical protein